MTIPETFQLQAALEYAARAHDGQHRRFGPVGTRLPYIVHPVRVMLYLKDLNYRTHVLQAALLHDVLEDCGDKVSVDEIKEKFGEEVQILVVELTNQKDPTLDRAAQKAADREKLRHVSYHAKMIKLADRLDNIREAESAPEHWRRRYIEETERLVDVIGDVHHYTAGLIRMECDRLRHYLSQPA